MPSQFLGDSNGNAAPIVRHIVGTGLPFPTERPGICLVPKLLDQRLGLGVGALDSRAPVRDPRHHFRPEATRRRKPRGPWKAPNNAAGIMRTFTLQADVQGLCYRLEFNRARMTILTVRHLTTYSYASPVRLGEHRMMLRPRDSNDQRLLKASLEIEPRPHCLRWIHDVFDNCVAIADFVGETRRLVVENNITLEHIALDEPEFLLEDRARFYPFSYAADEMPDLARAIERHHPDASGELDHWVRQFVNQGRPTETGALLMTLTNVIKESVAYERRTTRGTQSPLETLALRRGSCRDFATLMMEAARALGFAARFVSGYLYVPSRDSGESHRGGGSTHAWCQVYLPGSGWVEFDPTNGIVGNRDLIRVAVARDARQAIPLHGFYYGKARDEEGMVVSVTVRRLPDPEPSTQVLVDAEP